MLDDRTRWMILPFFLHLQMLATDVIHFAPHLRHFLSSLPNRWSERAVDEGKKQYVGILIPAGQLFSATRGVYLVAR